MLPKSNDVPYFTWTRQDLWIGQYEKLLASQFGRRGVDPPCPRRKIMLIQSGRKNRDLQNKRLRKAVKYDLVHHNFYDLIKRT